MRSTGLRSLARFRGAWPLALFAAGGALIVAGVALASVPAALVVAGVLVVAVSAAEVL